MKTFRLILMPLILSWALGACEPMNMETVCTEVFKTSKLTVLSEENGQPVDSLAITVTDKSSGAIYELCSEEAADLCPAGTPELDGGQYLIFHDGFKDRVNMQGETIIVEGQKEGIYFRQEYTFGSDDCHIRKIAGPDTIHVLTHNP